MAKREKAIKRENVIKALGCCISDEYNGSCPPGCPYTGPDYGPFDSCEIRLTRDALALLKKQIPRLVTENDFQRDDADCGGAIPCWKEPKSPTRREGWAVIVYGKWLADKGIARYWTGKPSEEQKRAVKWDG